MNFSLADEKFMKRALSLAEKGRGFVSPNPPVGCVIVKNGKIAASGWHRKFGFPHAEIEALKKTGAKAKGATMYVNLEPCAHFGKTPPCAAAIIESGIKRVVVAMKDPNPLVNGRGIKILKKSGVRVAIGCLKNEAEELNEVFIKYIVKEEPFVALKAAMSLDGKIATKTGDSKWITSDSSRKFVKNLRDKYDAVLVGIETVLKDNPRLCGSNTEPLRVILDSKLRIPLAAKVLRNKKVLIFTTKKAPRKKIGILQKKGFKIKIFPENIRIVPLLHFLGKQNISSVLVEGGSEIFGSFFDAKSVDKIYWFVAPKIIGGINAKPAVSGQGVNLLRKAAFISNLKILKSGDDCLFIGYPVFK